MQNNPLYNSRVAYGLPKIYDWVDSFYPNQDLVQFYLDPRAGTWRLEGMQNEKSLIVRGELYPVNARKSQQIRVKEVEIEIAKLNMDDKRLLPFVNSLFNKDEKYIPPIDEIQLLDLLDNWTDIDRSLLQLSLKTNRDGSLKVLRQNEINRVFAHYPRLIKF